MTLLCIPYFVLYYTGLAPVKLGDHFRRSCLSSSSLVSRHGQQLRDEPWKARASESKESVQALAVGVTIPWSGSGGADTSQAYCPCLEGSSLGSEKPNLSRYL